MIFKNASMAELLRSGKRLVCFGAGGLLADCCGFYAKLDFWNHIHRVLDNNVKTFSWSGNTIPVHSIESFLADETNLDNSVFLITCWEYRMAFAQLDAIPQLRDVECAIHTFVHHRPPPYEFPKHPAGAMLKIPKKIHYFWFGGGNIPEKNRAWMESWRKWCPDYEILRWDESNYDITKHPYMHAAYVAGKWAFASDYARLDIIYQHGGIYLDTDVEVLGNLDALLYDDAFCGFSSHLRVNTGLGFGAVPGFPLLKKFMDHYDRVSFYNPDGSLNLDDCGVQQTAVLDKLGLDHGNDSWQLVEGMRIYPTDVLSPMDYMCNPSAYTKNTLAVRHFEASRYDADALNIRQRIVRKNAAFWREHAAQAPGNDHGATTRCAQPKVSMILPCYNKVACIAATFESIIRQKWDAIELIIVNDGSTDGTGDVIAEYIPKLHSMGIDVCLVEQENRGVAAASYEGFKRASGEFICQIDADDELDPGYVSAMANWLIGHPDYDMAVCDLLIETVSGEKHNTSYFKPEAAKPYCLADMAASFLLRQNINSVWTILVRSEYFKRSGMLDNYYHAMKYTQEPQFFLPLAAAGGKWGHVQAPLYRYKTQNSSLATPRTYELHTKVIRGYVEISRKTIEHLPVDAAIKMKLQTLAGLMYYWMILDDIRHFCVHNPGVAEEAAAFVNSIFRPSPCVTRECFDDHDLVFKAVADAILGVKREIPNVKNKRIIAWGILGQRGRTLLQHLRGTVLAPDELWDMAGDDRIIKKPNIDELTSNDVVLLFPAKIDAATRDKLNRADCAILSYHDIRDNISVFKFPRFYDNDTKFAPGKSSGNADAPRDAMTELST